MMIEKIKKYLLRQPDIEFYSKHDSESEYFKLGNTKIRVSNHYATSLNEPTTLNIIVDGDFFNVVYVNTPIPIRNYEELKGFIKFFKPVSNGLTRYIRSTNRKSTKSVSTNTQQTTNNKKNSKKEDLKAFVEENKEGLNPKQINSFMSMIDRGHVTKESSIFKMIESYRKANLK